MSDLEDRGDLSRFNIPCPFCHQGVIDTASGTPAHTPMQLKWVGVMCLFCRRAFDFQADRVAPQPPS